MRRYTQQTETAQLILSIIVLWFQLLSSLAKYNWLDSNLNLTLQLHTIHLAGFSHSTY